MVPLVALVLWLTHGLLIARLRSESIQISEQQIPSLYHAYLEVCARLGVKEIPELYVLQQGGWINAFATRHAGRDFVVIYSSFLDVYPPDSSPIKFILGHELGHILRKHHFRHMLLYPALILPMIMEAYSRACESTCDRFGAVGAEDANGAAGALILLSGGRIAASEAQPGLFADQYRLQRGFFVSWHELISTYPTLSRRVAQVASFYEGAPFIASRRNGWAYFFALFANFRSLLVIYLFVIAVAVVISLGTKALSAKNALDTTAPTNQFQPTPSPSQGN